MKPNVGQGDKGETALIGGKARKNSERIEAIGAVDELNASIGVARSKVSKKSNDILRQVQIDLFELGALLAQPNAVRSFDEKPVKFLEERTDEIEGFLPKLKNFILPFGGEASALLHLSRAICRKAERRVFSLVAKEKVAENVARYLNRLSDLLFALARSEAKLEELFNIK